MELASGHEDGAASLILAGSTSVRPVEIFSCSSILRSADLKSVLPAENLSTCVDGSVL